MQSHLLKYKVCAHMYLTTNDILTMYCLDPRELCLTSFIRTLSDLTLAVTKHVFVFDEISQLSKEQKSRVSPHMYVATYDILTMYCLEPKELCLTNFIWTLSDLTLAVTRQVFVFDEVNQFWIKQKIWYNVDKHLHHQKLVAR